MIDVYIIEEHNEAFFIWNMARASGVIPDTGNTLLHIDEQSDLGVPRLRYSLNDLPKEPSLLERVTRNLPISSFIIPAIYQGMVSEVFWISRNHDADQTASLRRSVRSFNKQGKKLIHMVSTPEIDLIKDPDRRTYDLHLRTEGQIPRNQRVILDIDLRYFSSIENPSEYRDVKVEITPGEFDSFNSNRYHPMRFSVGGSVEVVKQEGKYYYTIDNYAESYPSSKKVNEAVILDRVNAFVNHLEESEVCPCLITICRSRHSGFTPVDQCDYIQEKLLERLNDVYVMALHNVGDVL